MKAWTVPDPIDHPRLTDKEVPAGKPVVQLKASALNHRDVWITKGLYPGIIAGATMGADGAGIYGDREVIIFPSVEWGGSQKAQHDNFRVLGVPDDGTFADFIAIDEAYIFDKPAHLSMVEAAALPLAGLTAYRALFSRGGASAGEKVLITGVGGGVALFAMQFAIHVGCEVYLTSSSEEKVQKAIALGAKGGYLYNDKDWARHLVQDVGGVDIIVDGACGSGFNDLTKAASPGGRIVFYGATRGNIADFNARAVFWKQLSILGSTMGSPDDFRKMLHFISQHEIVPHIDRIFRFGDLPLALAYMDAGHQFGKIVLDHG